MTAAYDVLGDTDKRKAYDEVRRLGPVTGVSFNAGATGGFGPGGIGFGPGHSGRAGVDLGDLLGDIFKSGQRGGRPGGPQR